MTTTATDDRNCDLIPEIINALEHNKAGNYEQRDTCLVTISRKLTERGDDPVEFWTTWAELMSLYNKG